MSVQKRVSKRADGRKQTAWRVRWKNPDGSFGSRTFRLKDDATTYDGEVKRLKRLGALADLDAGNQSLDEFVTGTWAKTYAPLLSAKTRKLYIGLYDHHLSPYLGSVALRQLSPELIARWQSDRLEAGAGPTAVAKSLTLLGNFLQRAMEGGHIRVNPARAVRRADLPDREEVRPLAPATVERMRAASRPRDAALISVLAYAGLRPGEALGLKWGDVRERTLIVQRSVILGAEKGTKTGAHRTVRLLAPLARDLAEWRLRGGRPGDRELIFPGHEGGPWSEPAYQSWRRRSFARALKAAGVEHARPYDLRHSFASLLLHEGRNVIYVARQLGHDANQTLRRYGHVIDELDDAPTQDAETAILAARSTSVAPQLPKVGG